MEFAYLVRPAFDERFLERATARERRLRGARHVAREAAGEVSFAGRCSDGPFGIVVFDARDEQHALRLMEDDPSVRSGVQTAELHPFSTFLARGAAPEGGAMTREPAVLGAPSAIGLVPDENGEPRRLDLAPDALRAQQLGARLRAHDLGDVEPPPRKHDIERPDARIRNEDDLAAFAHAVAERAEPALRRRQFLVLLGGDCSIVLGALLAARALDDVPPGVVYIDAHADFATLAESPSGSACSMALALAVGRESHSLARLASGSALTSGERVAHIGRRAMGEPSYGADALSPAGVLDLPKSAVDSDRAAAVAQQALDHVTGLDAGFWVHFDVDVLDPLMLPATGDPAPGGIDFDEAVELLRPLITHPQALGMQLTLYDPTLDPGGTSARNLVGMLERAFRA